MFRQHAVSRDHQLGRAPDSSHEGHGLFVGQAHRRRQGQAAIAAPGITARYGHQTALGQELRCFTADRDHAFHPRLDRSIKAVVDRLALVLQAQLRLQRHAQALGRVLAAGGRWDHAVNQAQVCHPLRHCPGQYQRDDGAQGVAK